MIGGVVGGELFIWLLLRARKRAFT
jgi:ABC-type enterochelin transport system permease subunit